MFKPLLKTNFYPLKTILSFALLGITVLILGCSVKKQSSKLDFIGTDDFVFIEYYLTQEGEVISGTAPKGMRIDGPTYRFDKDTKQLDIFRNDNLSKDSIKILLGNGKILKGAAGGGVSMRLTNIKKLPFSENKLIINSVDMKVINFTFDNQKVNIKVGDEWQSSTTRTDTIKFTEPTIIKTKSTFTIRYHGVLSKKQISGL